MLPRRGRGHEAKIQTGRQASSDLDRHWLRHADPSDLALSIAKANPGGVNVIFIKIGAALILLILIYLLFSILSSLLYTLLGGKENAEIASRIGTGRRR